MLLEGHLLERADPNRGRFRSLLLKALNDFLHDARDKRRAQKRGGDLQFVAWDEWMAELPSQFSVSARESESWPAEKVFDVRWAATVVERALSRLGEECEQRGRRRIFDVLSSCLAAEREDVSYSTLSQTLGVPEPTVKRLVHRMRQRYRNLLRDEVAETVADPAEVDDEIRHLYEATRATLAEWTQRVRAQAAGGFPEKVTAFREGMAVHGRYGKPCPACGAPVQRIVFAENETNYCARCQTGGKILADRSLSRLLKKSWPRSIDELG